MRVHPHPQRHPVNLALTVHINGVWMYCHGFLRVFFNFIRFFIFLFLMSNLTVGNMDFYFKWFMWFIYLFIYLFLCQFNLSYCISQRKMVQNFPLKQIKSSDHLSEDYLSLNSGKIWTVEAFLLLLLLLLVVVVVVVL